MTTKNNLGTRETYKKAICGPGGINCDCCRRGTQDGGQAHEFPWEAPKGTFGVQDRDRPGFSVSRSRPCRLRGFVTNERIVGWLLPGDLVARMNMHVGYIHLDDDVIVWSVIVSGCLENKIGGHSWDERYNAYNITLDMLEELVFGMPHTLYEYYRDGKQIFPVWGKTPCAAVRNLVK